MHVEKKTPSIMGQVNKANVLHLIKEQGPTSRAAIAKMLHMSPSTISSIVEQLIREGRIREGAARESTSVGGRRPVDLHYVENARFAFGVDIGATKSIALLTDLAGTVIYRRQFPSRPDGVSPMEHIRAQLEGMLRDSGVSRDDILGTAIGFPGVTMANKGVVVEANHLQLRDFSASDFFGTLPGPIWVDNDVNMAVIGERWMGAAAQRSNVVLIAIGSGIGAGLILDNRIYRGANSFAGELGHLQVDPRQPTEKRPLGDYGPLEQIASGKGIEDYAREQRRNDPDTTSRSGDQAHEIFAAASIGDPLAEHVIQRAIDALSFSIANMVTLLNPDVVIIGGGVARVGDPLIGRIRSGVHRLSPMPCDIVPAALGEDAAAFGSAATVLLKAGELRLAGFDDWLVVSSRADRESSEKTCTPL